MDVFVIIRYAGEATLDLCKSIIESQVGKNQLVVIEEKPFSKAVRKTFETGIKQNMKWTLAVDADILLLSNAIERLVLWAEKQEDYFFILQGRVFDKFFCSPRPGGPHLYRTEYLKKALTFIPEDTKILRPESHTYNKMAEIGYHFFQDTQIYGVHDFFQYEHDIFRKCFIHAIKHKQYLEYFLRQWSLRAKDDTDYIHAVKGFIEGLCKKDLAVADTSFFENYTSEIDFLKNLKLNKTPNFLINSVEYLIKSFKQDEEAKNFAQSTMSYIQRTDSIKRESIEPTINNELLYKLGHKIEKFGRKIKSLSVK